MSAQDFSTFNRLMLSALESHDPTSRRLGIERFRGMVQDIAEANGWQLPITSRDVRERDVLATFAGVAIRRSDLVGDGDIREVIRRRILIHQPRARAIDIPVPGIRPIVGPPPSKPNVKAEPPAILPEPAAFDRPFLID